MATAAATSLTRADALRRHIEERRARGLLDLEELEARKRAELEFHNMYRDASTKEQVGKDEYDLIYGNERFYRVTQSSLDYTTKWIDRHASGKVFLDYACGDGGNTRRAGRAGAALAVGIDLSDISVANATNLATGEGLGERCLFLQADCENTGFPDASFDTVVCSGVLHHMDLSFAFPELRRILAPGGRALAVEALNINPAIQWYRNRTPEMRTEWEKNHILGPRDLTFAKRFFDLGEVRYWHLAALVGAYAPKLTTALDRVDGYLTRVPLVQRLAWVFTFELIKPAS